MSRHGDAMARLLAVKERNDLAGERFDEQRGRFTALANRQSWKEKVVVSDNLFPTPPELTQRLVEAARLTTGSKVLEPSAGTGRLLDAIRASGVSVELTAAEICQRLCQHIYENYPSVVLKKGDFLTMDFTDGFDSIIMNPPFRRGTDVRHIMHAVKFLKPGGTLVALCYHGVQQRKLLEPVATTWEVLPEGSFQSEGTKAEVVMLTINK